MSKNFNDYDELLKLFENEPQKKTSKPDDAPNSQQNDEQQKSSFDLATEERRKKVQNFNLNINNEESKKPHTRGEVYFSNPPQELRTEQNRTPAPERDIYSSRPEREKFVSTAQPEQKAETKAAPPPASEKQKKVLEVKALQQQKKEKRKNSKAVNTLSSLALSLSIIIFFSVVLCVYGIRCINDILALKTEDKTVEVTISDGMSDGQVINILKKNDLINNRLFCKLFLKVIHITDDDYTGGKYVTGVYTLSPDMGLEKMLSTIQADFTQSETVTLTFPEGWTVDQIAQKLESNEVCTAASFITTLQSVDFSQEYEFLKSIDNKEARFRSLEGYIYPDTYEFYVGETSSSVVRRFLDNFKNRWIESYAEQAKALGMSVDDIVTLASILQKEAATNTQMPTISSVIYNRLSSSNFRWLQCDSTETYLLETIKPTLTSSSEDSAKYLKFRDSYDTYSTECTGLPLGPICNPGDSAIYAALHPEDTNYFYFRHDDEGKVYYASSFAEHEQNGRKIANSK